MPRIVEDRNAPWSNYHLTIGDQVDPQTLAPYLIVDHAARFEEAEGNDGAAIERLAASARVLQDYLNNCLDQMKVAPPSSFGMSAKRWSFSNLIGTRDWQIDISGLSGCHEIAASDLHPNCPVDHKNLAVVAGGTTLREIANWTKDRGLMVANSGTHLGPSIAGGYGTASHGSLLGQGGLQDMVLGVHLITGPGSSVWIERADKPVLTDVAIAALGATAIRDNAVFEDALIHLGGMGIVNGVAIELVANRPYFQARADVPLDNNWAQRIAEGRYDEISDSLMQHYEPELVGKSPVFYEVTFNPHDYMGDSALHILYYAAAPGKSALLSPPPLPRAGDAVVGFLQQFVDNPQLVKMFNPSLWNKGGDDGSPDPWPDQVPKNAYFFYRKEGKFFAKNPNDLVPLDWSQLHGDEITTGMPGALYNASFAVPRKKLPEALEAITQAILEAGLPPTFVFTARFVTRTAGTLAFTRFEETAVIEIDGASPWFMALMAKLEPDFADTAAQLAMVVRDGALIVRDALQAAGIDYSMHWAKLGELDAAKVEADFGPSDSSVSALSRWRSTRAKLLSPLAQCIFWNDALVNYGIVDRPTVFPPQPPITE
jgi:FAD/FMN-containing dehydrogenase